MQPPRQFAPWFAAFPAVGWQPMARSPRWPACRDVPASSAGYFSASTRQRTSPGTVSSTPGVKCRLVSLAMVGHSPATLAGEGRHQIRRQEPPGLGAKSLAGLNLEAVSCDRRAVCFVPRLAALAGARRQGVPGGERVHIVSPVRDLPVLDRDDRAEPVVVF